MVESEHIFAVLIIIILVGVYGFATTQHNNPIVGKVAPIRDPIVGDWIHTFPGGGYDTLSINSNGEFDELSFSSVMSNGIRSELAPIHGHWISQLFGRYNFIHDNGFIQVLTYSPSNDTVISENYVNVTFSRS